MLEQYPVIPLLLLSPLAYHAMEYRLDKYYNNQDINIFGTEYFSKVSEI